MILVGKRREKGCETSRAGDYAPFRAFAPQTIARSMEVTHTSPGFEIFLDMLVPDLHNGSIESRDTEDGSRDLCFSPPSLPRKTLNRLPLL